MGVLDGTLDQVLRNTQFTEAIKLDAGLNDGQLIQVLQASVQEITAPTDALSLGVSLIDGQMRALLKVITVDVDAITMSTGLLESNLNQILIMKTIDTDAFEFSPLLMDGVLS